MAVKSTPKVSPITSAGHFWNRNCEEVMLMAGARQKPHWWLESASEVCSECRQTYAYGTEYRCICCDVAFCSMCFEGTVSEVLCITCRRPENRS
jgi:hypothetical protein